LANAPTITRRASADADTLFSQYEAVFGTKLTAGSRRRWQWQYLENPHTEAQGPAIWVAREGETLLGQYASMPVRLWWQDGEVASSWGMDVFLREEARGKGIGAALFTTWADSVDVALGLGLTPSSYGLFKKLRYDDVGPVPFYQKVLDAEAVATRRLGSVAGTLAAPLVAAGLGLFAPERSRATTDVEVRRTDAFPDECDALWERARSSYTMCVRRDAAYLRWKYLACPTKSYEVREAWRGGGLCGFAVSRHEEYEGIRLGWIIDVFARTDDHAAKDALIGSVLDGFREAGVARAQAFAMNGALGEDLKARGFFAGKSPMQFCVRANVPSQSAFANPGGWHVVFGDSDMDR
jgi:GNAT superfamily N-acetyltransferase